MNDADALDKISALHLGENSYDDPSSALESISMLITATGRKVEGWADE